MSLQIHDSTQGLQLITARHASIRRVFAEEHLARRAYRTRPAGFGATLAALPRHISARIRRHGRPAIAASVARSDTPLRLAARNEV